MLCVQKLLFVKRMKLGIFTIFLERNYFQFGENQSYVKKDDFSRNIHDLKLVVSLS